MRKFSAHQRMNCAPNEVRIEHLKPGEKFTLSLPVYGKVQEGEVNYQSVGRTAVRLKHSKDTVRHFRTADGREVEFETAGMNETSWAPDTCVEPKEEE